MKATASLGLLPFALALVLPLAQRNVRRRRMLLQGQDRDHRGRLLGRRRLRPVARLVARILDA